MLKPFRSPKQLTLGVDRGQVLAMLRRVQLGGPSHKAFLFALVMHADASNGGPVSCRYCDWAETLNVGLKSAYRIAKKLDSMGVIIRVHERGKVPRFAVCWSNLWALDEEQAQVSDLVRVPSARPPSPEPPGM